jgi:type I restriction enzyme S subunit
VLINSTGTGTLGRVAQCWEHLEGATVDTHITIVRPMDDIGIFWFGYALMSLQYLFEKMGEGATNQKELKRIRIAETKVLKPTHLLIKNYKDYVEPITKQIRILIKQNQKLKAARDLLLPKLMNGEIPV